MNIKKKKKNNVEHVKQKTVVGKKDEIRIGLFA